MDTEQFVASQFQNSARLLERLAAELSLQIATVGEILRDSLASSNKVLIFGNGGSAADAQHFAAELIGRYRQDRPSLPAIALTTDTSALTAIGNDYGFEQVFSRQVEALVRPGDVAFGISTSGRSPNVIAGLQAARQRGARTVALIGPHAETAGRVADEVISILTDDMPRVQEAHAVIIHILCDLIESKPE